MVIISLASSQILAYAETEGSFVTREDSKVDLLDFPVYIDFSADWFDSAALLDWNVEPTGEVTEVLMQWQPKQLQENLLEFGTLNNTPLVDLVHETEVLGGDLVNVIWRSSWMSADAAVKDER